MSLEIDYDNDVIYSIEKDKKKRVGNFSLKIIGEVTPPEGCPIGSLKGFIVEVAQKTAHRRGCGQCFIPESTLNMGNMDKFNKAIQLALPTGHPMLSVTKAKLKELTLDLLDDYCERGSDVHKQAVVCLGRQPEGDIFVFNAECILRLDGTPVANPPVLLPGIFEAIGLPVPVPKPLMEVAEPLKSVCHVLRLCLGNNLISGLYLLGATVISLMYKYVVSKYNNCHIPIAFGTKNMGKTTASDICVSAIGQQTSAIKDITDAQVAKMLWAGLPFVYDDPSDLKQMKTMIMNAFGGGIIGSSRLAMSAGTVPLVCANEFIVQALSQEEDRYISRCLLIPFLHRIEYNLRAVEEVNRLKPTLSNALPGILQLGRKLVHLHADKLQELKATALSATADTIDERLAVGYAMLLWVTMKIAHKVGVPKENVLSFFHEKMAPLVHQYQGSNEPIEIPLGKYLTELSQVATTQEVLTVINPATTYHTEEGQIDGIAVRVTALLEMLTEKEIPHVDETVLRALIKKRKGCKPRAKQYFLKAGEMGLTIKRDSTSVALGCVCIPYRDVPEEFTLNLHEGLHN